MKGTKGPFALEDKDSPPTERVRITNCVFKRGYGAVTLGSEASIVRDITVENSRFLDVWHVLHLKVRPDTPQHYENIQLRNITLDNPKFGSILEIRPWTQYFDLQGQPAPKSIIRKVTFSGIRGRFSSLGRASGNPGQTDISDITFADFDVKLGRSKLRDGDAVRDLTFTNVIINGEPVSVSAETP
jgi:polygalacturonase